MFFFPTSYILPTLPQDGGLSIEPTYVEQFSELNEVLEAFTRKDVEPALQ